MTWHRVAPASSTQHQFWLLQKLQPDTVAYIIPCLFTITGPLDIRAAEGAFQDLAVRHATLRTTFEQRADRLMQCVHEALPVDFGVEDCSPEALAPRIEDALRLPFDLEHGPLWRVRVFRTGPNTHALTWTLHHIIVDLATKELFAKDFAAFYAYRVAQKSAPSVEPEETTCIEFAEREAAWNATPASKKCDEYFLEYLRGRTAPLALPEDFPRPKYRPKAGGCISFDLDSSLCARLSQCCTATATKPYLALLAAWGVLLARYSSADSVVVGVPLSNRRIWQCSDTAGCFVKTLPVVIEVPREETFVKQVARVRASLLGHHRHQEIGFDRVISALKLPLDPSRNPIYQAGFTFEPPMALELAGLDVESSKVHCGGSQLDVFLTLWPTPKGFSGQLEYACELFTAETARQIVDSYLSLLSQVTEPGVQDTVPVGQLRLLTESMRRTVLETFNATTVDYAGPARLQHLFYDQARRSESAPALRFGGRTLSYGELMAKAQGLAHSLRGAGLVPGDHIGVYMHRSTEMVVAILAILMAGGVYLPIDPDYPALRIQHMLEDASPRQVLSHSVVASTWPGPAEQLRLVDVEQCVASPFPPEEMAVPRDAAYTIFTSGSTGRPKGATNTHQGIINRILWMQEAFKLNATDVVLQKTPFSFDVSTWEFFWPLAVGAVLEVAPAGIHRDPGGLCQLIMDAQVTTIHFVPSMLDAFLNHPRSAQCQSLRRIIASGEALSTELVRRCAARTPAELHNLYGPTEAAVDVTWWPCAQNPSMSPVPIGKAIANTRMYILDPQQQPVPVGVSGELYIGGVQVALGYVSRPELTAERFLPDPFSGNADDRLYRTGDLAKWLPDGNIIYLGRTDSQVKLHGNRIELSEIEQVLERATGVRQCVVLVRELGESQRVLVAYVRRTDESVAANPGTEEFISGLRSRVSGALPPYMVPSQFILMEEFPLTASGKVDRRALPAPAPQESAGISIAEPTTQMETWLRSQVQELLGLSQVSVTANLFEIGGSSITVAQLVGRIFEHRGVEIPLVKFFEFPSIASMAAYLSEVSAGTPSASSIAGADALESAKSRAKQRRELASAGRSRRSS